jgi:LmbE family N-acetylglucosaminyl deacetylase
MRRLLLAFLLTPAVATVLAQTPQSLSSSEILIGLKKLNTLGSVLYVAAHPDDENTRLLAYFSKEKLYRTGYLSLTRGDGGQNLIGTEQGIELGMIRTQELLSARRIDGAEQFFTRAYDFGFSKSTDEALKTWDRNKILSDVVWVIRKFQPDIIITRFPQDSRAGHGHHSSSAVLAVEAFTAAADPNQFPEQLKYVKPWQAKRVLWNTFNFGTTNTTSNDQFKMDVGAYNPILGKGYGEIASESRSQHKSQGFGVPRQRGEALEYFSLWKGSAPVNDLMDEVTTSWARVKGGEAVQQMVDEIIKNYSLFEPGKSVKPLTALYTKISSLEDGYWKQQKLKEVKLLIEACTGLWAEATTSTAQAVQTDSLRVSFSINNRNGNNIVLKRIVLDKFDSVFTNRTLGSNRNFSFIKPVYISNEAPITQPYWLQNEMKEGRFEVNDQQLIGNADNAASYTVKFVLEVEGLDVEIEKPVRYKFTDPVKGELYEPLTIVPPVQITPGNNLLLSNSADAKSFRLTVRALKDITKPVIKLAAIKGWETTGINYVQPDTLKKDQEMDVDVTIKPVLKDRELNKQPILASVQYNNEWYATLVKNIRYDHIPDLTYFRIPVINVLSLDLKTSGKKIGFIEGAGDYMPTALQQMGYEVIILSDRDLANSNLQQYDAIITGVRAYNIKNSLNTYYPKLMKYIENGGNLIVQYNTSNQIGPVRAKIGPYPFDISRNRITDEKAAMNILKPEHPVLNFPNKISSNDFDNWVQERSIYHASRWDKNYETIFSMADAGESADEGALITTSYGKGKFTYAGLVFFRQLPAGVPGAYRLLANIIALNRKKGF